IRYAGLGVGGYCLSKDPLFGPAAAREIFGFDDLTFPLSTQSVAINDSMPLASASLLAESMTGDLQNKRVLILGASYRPDVSDTRNSPSLRLAVELVARGAVVEFVDPLADELPGLQ